MGRLRAAMRGFATGFRPSASALESTMRRKTDEELHLLLHFHSGDYTPEAVKVATEEFDRRKLDEATMSRIVAIAEKALEDGDGKLRWPEGKPTSDAASTGTHYWHTFIFCCQALGLIILLCFAGYAIYGGYGWLDSMGWISHREDTVITAGSGWLAGESKECWSEPLNAEGAAQSGKAIGYAMSSVTCDDGPDHSMKVTFYGRKVQAEYKAVSWRCTRNEVSFLNDNSFSCYETGGQR